MILGLLRVVAATLAVAVGVEREASALALSPGHEAAITALSADLPRLLAVWAAAMALPGLVLARGGRLQGAPAALVNAWTALAGVHLVVQGTLPPSAAHLEALVLTHVLATGLGVLALAIGWRGASRPPGVNLDFWSPLVLAASAVAALAWWGEGPGGTRINLVIDGHTLQLLELLPFGVAVSAVWLWAATDHGVARGKHWVTWAIAVVAVLAVVVFRVDDRGAALVVIVALGLVAVWMIDLGAVVPVPLVAALIAIAAAVAVQTVAGHADALLLKRILMRADPFENGLAGGEQLARALLAVEHGGWFGVAPGVFDVHDVPAAQNDMIVPVFAGRFGVVAALAWLVFQLRVVGLLLHGGGRDVRRWSGPRRAVGAIGLTLAAKLLCNVLGAVGVLPLTGLCAPMLSAGDSALVCAFAAFGYAVGLLAPDLRGATVDSRAPATRVWSLIAALSLPAAGSLLLYATAAGRGAAHSFYVTTDGEGRLRAFPPPDLLRLDRRVPRPALLARDGEAFAVTAPDGSRIRVGSPTVAEAVGRPGDVSGSLEAAIVATEPRVCPERGYRVGPNGEIVGRGPDPLHPEVPALRPCTRDLGGLTPLLTLDPQEREARLAGASGAIQTTLDRGLSLRLASLVETRLGELPAAAAGILVLRDAGGHILAELVARRPGVLGRRWSDPANLAVSIFAPPGSLFKAVVVAAADAEGVPRDARLPCVKKAGRGRIRVCGPRGCSIIRDFPRGVHSEDPTISEILERSCNAGTIGLALQTDGTRIASMIGRIGRTAPPELSDAQRLAEASIGQGIVSFSAEDINAGLLAVASDGVLRRCELADGPGPCPAEELVPAESAAWTRSLMLRVVEGEHGTARAARLPPGLHAALKSGTAQDLARADDPHGGDDAWLGGVLFDDAGHTVALTLFFPHAEVTGGTLASLVPEIAGALVAEGYLDAPPPVEMIETESTLTDVVSR